MVVIAAPLEIAGTLVLLARWHDPGTLVAIRGSSGLQEVLTLPLLMLVPGVVIGMVGGMLGAAARKIRSA